MAKILIIDDRSFNRQYLNSLLGYQDHELFEAKDGLEGLNLARTKHPDLIISDVLMPTMDGYEFVRRLRAEPEIKQTKVIFSTAHFLSREARALANKCGVTEIIYKPCEPKAVLEIVGSALSGVAVKKSPAAAEPEEFNREHLSLLTNKLAEKTDQLRDTQGKLTALIDLDTLVAHIRDPLELLSRYAAVAREIIAASWSMIALLDATGSIQQLATVGLSIDLTDEMKAALVKTEFFKALIKRDSAMGLSISGSGGAALALPEFMPRAHCLLAAPMAVRGRTRGWICLGDKIGLPTFSEQEEHLATALAAKMAIGYDNAALYRDSTHYTATLEAEIARRTKVEEELTESRARLAGIIGSAMDAIITIDESQRITLFNAAAETIFACSAAEAIGQSISRFMPERFRREHAQQIHDFGETGVITTRTDTIFGLRATGEEFPLEASISQIEVANQKLYTVIMRDITESEKTAAALRASEEQFRTMANSIPQLAWMARADGFITWYNQRWHDYTGKTAKEMEGWGWQSVHDPEVLPRVMEKWKAALAAGEPLEMEFPLRSADGQFRTFLTRVQPVKDANGKVLQWFGTNTDVDELRRTEKARLESEGRYRTLFEYAPEGILISDTKGNYVDANESICRLLGYGREEVLLLQPSDLMVPTGLPDVQPSFPTFGSENNYHRECKFRRRDGSLLPADVVATQMPDGSPVAMVRDISLLKETQTRIEHLNRVYAVLSDINKMIVRTRDPQKIFEEACRIAVEKGHFLMAWIGLLDEQKQRIDPQAWSGAEAGYLKAINIDLTDEVRAQGPTSRAARNGKRVLCNDVETDPTMAPWREDALKRGYRSSAAFPLVVNGKTIGNFNLYSPEIGFFDAEEVALLDELALDISFALEVVHTEMLRQQVQEELHRTTARLEEHARLLDLANVLVRQMDGKIVMWNTGAQELYGWTKEEAVGRVSHDLFQSVFPTSREDVERELLESGHWIGELLHRHKDGHEVWVASHQIFHRGDFNSGPLILEVNNDITELKEADRELRLKSQELASMTEQLWQASKLATMGELAASIAHELNNPLTTVTLSIDVLMMQLADDERKIGTLKMVRDEAERMANLVSNLLHFSRRSHAEISTLRVPEELSSTFDLIGYHLRRRNVRVIQELEDNLPTIQADRQQLRQVFINLLTNAGDAMSDGGTLTVRARRSEFSDSRPAVLIEFADNGAGINEENLKRIWEPFFTTKPEGKGTGLGLPICKRTIEEHRGTIEVESRLHQGTTFRIQLPATITG